MQRMSDLQKFIRVGRVGWCVGKQLLYQAGHSARCLSMLMSVSLCCCGTTGHGNLSGLGLAIPSTPVFSSVYDGYATDLIFMWRVTYKAMLEAQLMLFEYKQTWQKSTSFTCQERVHKILTSDRLESQWQHGGTEQLTLYCQLLWTLAHTQDIFKDGNLFLADNSPARQQGQISLILCQSIRAPGWVRRLMERHNPSDCGRHQANMSNMTLHLGNFCNCAASTY